MSVKSLPPKSATRTLTPAVLSIWRCPQGVFLFTTHSLYTVQHRTNQMPRNATQYLLSARQTRGLSWVSWVKSWTFGVQWTGTDIVRQWYEVKQASFPGWKPFQWRFRCHLRQILWTFSTRIKASRFTESPINNYIMSSRFLFKQ